MKDFKPLKSLEDVQNIQVEDIIGVGQLASPTIHALCISHKDGRISLLGNMDNQVIVKYDFASKDVEGFYNDGSIVMACNVENREYVEKCYLEYGSLREKLISAGIWEEEK